MYHTKVYRIQALCIIHTKIYNILEQNESKKECNGSNPESY